MTYKEFISQIKKVKQSRKHEITNSLGVYDAYKYIRKNKWFNIGTHLTEKQFYKIIRTINAFIAEQLTLGKEVKLPHQMGTLEARKRPSRITIKDCKLVTNLPIDWKATFDLWYNDEEAYKNKTIVRKELDTLYSVYYNRKKAKYNNKKFFEFILNREIAKQLNANIIKYNINTFLLYHYE